MTELFKTPRLRTPDLKAWKQRQIRVLADAKNFAYFNAHHAALRDDRRLKVRKMQGDVDQEHWTYLIPDFLSRKAYHFRTFNLVQKQWNEEVEKMLRNDTQLFPGLVFPDNDTSGR